MAAKSTATHAHKSVREGETSMTMRRVLATATAAVMGLGVVLASGVAARAQDETKPPAAPARAGRRAGRTPRQYQPPIQGQLEAAKIELTADQKAKLKTLTDKMMADRKALQDKNLAQDEQRKQTMALGRKFRTDAMAILTDEQKAQLKASRAARPARARRNAPAAEGAKPAEKKTE